MQWKAWQRGALVLDVSEAYTSKTCSWDGTVNSKAIRGRRPRHKRRPWDLPAGAHAGLQQPHQQLKQQTDPKQGAPNRCTT